MNAKLAKLAFAFSLIFISFTGGIFVFLKSERLSLDSLRAFVRQFTPKTKYAGAGIVLVAPSPVKKVSQEKITSKPEIKQVKPKPQKQTQENQKQKPKESPNIEIPLDEKEIDRLPKETKQKIENSAVSCAIIENALPQQDAIIFNEIAWMGTFDSSNNEWFELRNISNTGIPLIGWQITNKSGKIRIVFDIIQEISSQHFFLLERTDDLSVPSIPADFMYTNALANTNEELYLFDEHCVLRDKVIANPDWPAGNNAGKRSMERGLNLNWHTFEGQAKNSIFGTPKAENTAQGAGAVIPSVYLAVSGGGGGIEPKTETKKPYSKILISEAQIAGIDSQTEEFVELYNPNNQDVLLTNWYLHKKTKNSLSFSTFVSSSAFLGKTIKANDYFLIARAGSAFELASNIITESSLADDNTLALKNPDQEIVDTVGWESIPNGKSFGRISYDSQDFEIQTPTPKLLNQPELEPTPALTPIPTPEPVPAAQDQTPPNVSFEIIDPLLSHVSFSLSWTGIDPEGDVSPSNINGFYLQYAVTPSQDGVFLRYQKDKALQDWIQGDIGALSLDSLTTSVSVSAKDGIGYLFSIIAKDGSGNQSEPSLVSIEINLPKTVVINEIAWAGTKAKTSDEWIELFNNTDSLVNLAGWKIEVLDGTPSITLQGVVGPKDYYLLERTDDNTIKDIPMDQRYTGALGNEGERLELYDSQGNIIDVVDALGSWFAGDSATKQTMERIDALKSGSDPKNWASNNQKAHNGQDANGNLIDGTPKQLNSVSF